MISERLAVIDERGQIDVWVVDDDDQSRLVTALALHDDPAVGAVESYVSAEEMFLYLETTQDSRRIVLMDIVLPGVSGLDAIPRIKAISPSTRVAVMTGYNTEENILKALRLGAHGFLVKPVSVERLNAVIRDVRDDLVHIDKEAVKKLTDSMQARSLGGKQYDLTVREKEILNLLRDGLGDDAIAGRLGMSAATLRKHMEHLHSKLAVHDRAGVILKIFKENLI